jgi:hypothetical protein
MIGVMSVSVEHLQPVRSLTGIRRLHNETAILRRPLDMVGIDRVWRLDLMARLAIQVTPFVRHRFLLSRLSKENIPILSQLVITDEEASAAFLQGTSLDELQELKIGRYAVSDYVREPVVLGKAGPFARLFEPHAGAESFYVGTEIDKHGRVRVHDLSPKGTDIQADWGGAFMGITAEQINAHGDLPQEAKILPFPSRSAS